MKRPDKPERPAPQPQAPETPGVSELERMTDLTRRIINVPAKELAREKQKGEKKRTP